MSLETWLAFVAASAVLLLIPGPTILLVVSYALGQGKQVAFPVAAGVALGDFTAMTLSMLGVGALLSTSATLFTALKWIGAAYLIWLGIKLFRAGGAPALIDEKRRGSTARHDRACLAGHRAEPEGHHLLRRLPAAVPRSAGDFLTQMLVFEAPSWRSPPPTPSATRSSPAAPGRRSRPVRDPLGQPDRRQRAGRRRRGDGRARPDAVAMRRDIVWETLPGAGSRPSPVEIGQDLITADWALVADFGSGGFRLHYSVRCGGSWRFVEARLGIEQRGEARRLDLLRPRTVPGRSTAPARPDLAGCDYIDIMASPFTNTLPIRDLSFVRDQPQRIQVAYITVPELNVTRQEQDYTRLDDGEPPRRFRYRGASGFVAEVDVDEDGIVVDYGDIWRRRTE